MAAVGGCCSRTLLPACQDWDSGPSCLIHRRRGRRRRSAKASPKLMPLPPCHPQYSSGQWCAPPNIEPTMRHEGRKFQFRHALRDAHFSNKLSDLEWRLRPATASCLYRKLDSAIMVMKSAKDRPRYDAAYVLNSAGDRSVFAKRSMGPQLVIISGISRQDSA
jgi:hypothetical protein